MATAQQNTIVVTQGAYSAVKVSAPVSVPTDHDTILIAIKRTALPNVTTNVVTVRIDLSLDAGVTWSPLPSGQANWSWGSFPYVFNLPGGTINDQSGSALTSSYATVKIGTGNANRRLRVTILPKTIITTQVTLSTNLGRVDPSVIL